MGRFSLFFFTFSVVFLVLRGLADGSAVYSKLNPPHKRGRTLLQNPVIKDSIADPPAEKELPLPADREDDDPDTETSVAAEAPENRKIGKHHSSDKSVAGGGVIIGGLVTAIFAVVYCYIRVTRTKQAQTLT